MAPKKAVPNKRKAAQCDGDEMRRKKAKKVFIDESDEEREDGRVEMHQNGHDEPMELQAPQAGADVGGDDDEVVSEVGIFLLPTTPTDTGVISTAGGIPSSVCINRLQFPQQHPSLLRRRFNCPMSTNRNRVNDQQSDDGDEDGDDDYEHRGAERRGRKCFAQYKAQVRHLRLGFGSDGEEEMVPGTSFAGGGGIAELLTKQNRTPPPSTASLFSPPPSASSSSLSAAKGESSAGDMFTGEGFSQQGLLNYAVGFFKEGRLFLLPVDKTYEMRKPLKGTIERESAARVTALKASSSISSASLRSTADSAAAGSATASTSSSSVTAGPAAPLRIRFARAENDMQKRRREQSSFYKQKLVEQDQWVPLKVEQRNLMEMYEKDTSQVLSTKQPPS